MDNDILRQYAAKVVKAYLSKNKVSTTDVSSVITSVFDSLANLEGSPVVASEETRKPAISVKKSITPDAIICLECGKSLKVLKRHLTSDHGLTVEEYKATWGLPADYPTVAPNYSEVRSERAKQIGLGQKRKGKSKGAAMPGGRYLLPPDVDLT